jgi:hypothetical protein
MDPLHSQAMLSLAHKLHKQRETLLNEGPSNEDLFDSTNQTILATLRQPQSIKEWNELMSMMISA